MLPRELLRHSEVALIAMETGVTPLVPSRHNILLQENSWPEEGRVIG